MPPCRFVGPEVEGGELGADVGGVAVGDLGDEHLDQHLQDGAVEFLEGQLAGNSGAGADEEGGCRGRRW